MTALLIAAGAVWLIGCAFAVLSGINRLEEEEISENVNWPVLEESMTYMNHIETKSGKAVAVCCCCNRKSRPVEVCSDGEPDIWKMPQGWSQSPYPAGFRHRDGSLGSIYGCPECNKRLRRGETLILRGGVPANASLSGLRKG